MNETKHSSTVTWQEILEAAKQAQEEVEKWPEWKRSMARSGVSRAAMDPQADWARRVSDKDGVD